MKNALRSDAVKIETLKRHKLKATASVTVNGITFEAGIILKVIFINHTFKDGSEYMSIDFTLDI